MAIRTRRDAWAVSKVDEWDDVFLWYARAVREMRKRALNDPTGWRYQAAIHEYRPKPQDPYSMPNDKFPSASEQKKFWSQCQHNTWYFLPWHRWYLLYFEQIVAATVVSLGGPADWSLPFWNYSDASNADARRIPPAFIEKKMPDGSPNGLFVKERNFGNDGAEVGDDDAVGLKCLDLDQFVADASHIGFGGPKTGFNHSGGQPLDLDSVEVTPHGTMHGAVGKFMGRFNTAGLDPLFWCHHANIDRLWAVWRARKPSHVDPVDSAWLDMSFPFHDATPAVVTRLVRDAVDTSALGYVYEGVAEPEVAPAEEGILEGVAMAEKRIPEMVGASEAPTPLGRGPSTARVAVTPPTGPAMFGAEAVEAPPERVFVNIENITGDGEPRRYSVYVNDVFAGVIPLFGVQEASSASESHPGDGLHYRVDVTNIVQQLQAGGNWDPQTVRVTFVPAEDKGEEALMGAEAAEAAPQFQIGRVSVSMA